MVPGGCLGDSRAGEGLQGQGMAQELEFIRSVINYQLTGFPPDVFETRMLDDNRTSWQFMKFILFEVMS